MSASLDRMRHAEGRGYSSNSLTSKPNSHLHKGVPSCSSEINSAKNSFEQTTFSGIQDGTTDSKSTQKEVAHKRRLSLDVASRDVSVVSRSSFPAIFLLTSNLFLLLLLLPLSTLAFPPLTPTRQRNSPSKQGSKQEYPSFRMKDALWKRGGGSRRKASRENNEIKWPPLQPPAGPPREPPSAPPSKPPAAPPFGPKAPPLPQNLARILHNREAFLTNSHQIQDVNGLRRRRQAMAVLMPGGAPNPYYFYLPRAAMTRYSMPTSFRYPGYPGGGAQGYPRTSSYTGFRGQWWTRGQDFFTGRAQPPIMAQYPGYPATENGSIQSPALTQTDSTALTQTDSAQNGGSDYWYHDYNSRGTIY